MDSKKKIDERAWIAAWIIQAEEAQDLIEEPDQETLNDRAWMAEIISDVMSGMLPAEEFLRRVNLERIAQEKILAEWNSHCCPRKELQDPEYPFRFPNPEKVELEEGDVYPLVRLGTTPPLSIPRKKVD
jgi:hypothetical protein